MAWYRVAAADALADGEVLAVEVNERPLVLTRVGAQFGVLAPRCPHMGGPLGEGEIAYGFLTCPWHGREFHPLTGRCEGYEEHVESYPVELREGTVYVEIAG